MNKAVFLDRDGTINVDYGFVYKLKDLKFIPRTSQALKNLQSLGYLLIIITNQSGIGRGYYGMDDYRKFMKHMLADLSRKNITIAATYVCPHHPDANCACRKPKTLLFERAKKRFNVDKKHSYIIGDKTEDLQTGKNFGICTILVSTGKGGKDGKYKARPDYKAKDLYDASLWIKNKESSHKKTTET